MKQKSINAKTWREKVKEKTGVDYWRQEKYIKAAHDRYSRNKELLRDKELQKRYGISFYEYNSLMEKQNFACAICEIDVKLLKKGLAVDHCHVTGKVRKLLCGKCNTALGYLKEDVKLMKKMIEYVERYS